MAKTLHFRNKIGFARSQGASPPRGLCPRTPRIFSPKKWTCSLDGRPRSSTEAQEQHRGPGAAQEAQGATRGPRERHRGSGSGTEAQERHRSSWPGAEAQRLRRERRGSGASAEAHGRAQRRKGAAQRLRRGRRGAKTRRLLERPCLQNALGRRTTQQSRLSVQDRNTKPSGSHRDGLPISLGGHRRPRLYRRREATPIPVFGPAGFVFFYGRIIVFCRNFRFLLRS
jgi:hypothetical protein